jgi:hypothetical protein
MIPLKNNRKKSTLSFKVIVVCLLLSGSLVSPSFAIPDPEAIAASQYEDSWQHISGTLTADDAVEERFGVNNWKLVDNYELFDAVGQSVSIYIKGNPEIDVGGLCDPMGLVYDSTNPNTQDNIDVNDDGGQGGFTDGYTGLTCQNSPFDSFFTIHSWDSNYRIAVSSNGSLIDEYDRTLDTVNSGDYTLYVSVGNFDGPCYVVVATVLTNGTTCTGSLGIDNTVTSIGDSAFYGSGLTSVTIGNLVTNIGNEAFASNLDLISVDFGNSVAIIGDDAFANNPALASVDFGDFVTIIGYGAFANNPALTSVIIPDSVTSIGPVAFWNNVSLGIVTFLGVAAPAVDEDAFKDVYIGATAFVAYNATGIETDGYGFWKRLFVNYESAPISNVDCTTLGEPDGYFTIEDNVVTGNTLCAGEAIIPSGVTSIEDDAFHGNIYLTSVTIPDSLISIGLGAFRDNTALTSVDFGNSVESIGAYAFTYTGLTSIRIPDSVTSIDQAAFENNSALTTVTFLGNRLTSIGESVFAYNPDLTSITIPNSVTSIGDYAFKESGLTSVTIGNFVTSIGTEAFMHNTALTSVDFGNSVRSIGNGAFNGNTSLASVIIPDSVTSIGNDAFLDNFLLTSVTIGNSVTSIGEYAFTNTVLLTSVTIGNSVESIGASAFEGSDLRSVIIPDSVSSIGEYAFLNNYSLTSFTFLGITAPTVYVTTFLSVDDEATANVLYNATGFVPVVDGFWNGLFLIYGSAPVDDPPLSGGDSGSSTDPVTTPTVVQTADASFKLTNRKYLSKFEIRKAITKGRSFKRKPIDFYKYSISKTSKKSCVMSGNYVVALKDTGSCEIWVTRTTAKGTKYKYWVKINYIK